MAIYGDKELSEGKLKKCIREELTSGDAGAVALFKDELKRELREGIREEITSGATATTSLLSDIIKNELTSGTDATMRLSEIIKNEIKAELTSGSAGSSSPLLSDIIKNELTSGTTTSMLLSDIIQTELTSGTKGTSSLLSAILKKEIQTELTSGTEGASAAKGYAEKTFFSSGNGTTAWDGTTSITANTTSDALDTVKFGMKTISFHSNVAGTLKIEVQTPATTETWLTYDTISVEADKLDSYIISAQIIAVRLSFSATDTITAWTVMKYL